MQTPGTNTFGLLSIQSLSIMIQQIYSISAQRSSAMTSVNCRDDNTATGCLWFSLPRHANKYSYLNCNFFASTSGTRTAMSTHAMVIQCYKLHRNLPAKSQYFSFGLVITIDNHFGRTALFDILQPASAFGLQYIE